MECLKEGCQCEAVAMGFCSEYCANVSQQDEEGLCNCGHDSCHPPPRRHAEQTKISVGRGPGSGPAA